MPCPSPDRNALPPQDAGTFERVVGERPDLRRRLQELALAIPALDGVGEDLAKAKEYVEDLRRELDSQIGRVIGLEESYARRHAFCFEEREILRDLGLTQNLFRTHEPDYSKGEGLDS